MQQYFVDKAAQVDPREEKLPAWVRDKMATLRRAAKEARDELTALKSGGSPGPLWLENWDDQVRFYLPPEAGRLRYGDPAGGANIILYADSQRPGWLVAQGEGRGLIIAPSSSNVVLIRSQDAT